MMLRVHLIRILLLAAAGSAQTTAAQSTQPERLPDESVVASRDGVELTLAEVDAKIRSMPADIQKGYLTDPDRIGRFIDSVLLAKQIAREAEASGITEDAQFQQDIHLMRIEMLANRYIQSRIASIREPNFELMARERYLASPKQFAEATQIDLRHILFSTDGYDDASQKALAEEARKRLDAGEDFQALIKDYSTKYEKAVHSDLISNADTSRFDAKFAQALATIQRTGDYAGPVRSRFGYHVIRLERYEAFPVPPYEQVKERIINELRNEFMTTERNRLLATFSKQDIELNGEAVRSLPVRYLDADGAGTTTGAWKAAAPVTPGQ